MGDESSRETPQRAFDDYGECPDCGEETWLAVTDDGRYCSECIPAGALDRLLKDTSGTD